MSCRPCAEPTCRTTAELYTASSISELPKRFRPRRAHGNWVQLGGIPSPGTPETIRCVYFWIGFVNALPLSRPGLQISRVDRVLFPTRCAAVYLAGCWFCTWLTAW